jgi:2-dehydropantoate 2-reductase
MRIAVYGSGAVGGCIGGWLVEAGHDVTFIGRPATVAALDSCGLTLGGSRGGDPARTLSVRAAVEAASLPPPDLVLLGVKNFALEQACAEILAAWGNRPTVLGLQNGLDNQSILPRHFARPIFGIVCFNAWRDSPAVFGYQRRGPVVLGVLDRLLVAERDRVQRLLEPVLACQGEERIADAARCKMLINLANSVMTLVGQGVRPIEDVGALRRCVSSVLYEGMQVLRSAGVREVRLPHAPGWTAIRLATHLPAFMADPVFARNLAKVRMTSMGQDVYLAGRSETELDSLNGWFVNEARRLGFPAPRNEALYATMQQWLQQPEPRPLHERELWGLLQAAR